MTVPGITSLDVAVHPEHRPGEADLRRSEERYRRLFETAQDGILILDAGDGHIDDVNPFLLTLLGFSYDELIGKQLWEIGFFKDIQANQDAFRVLKQDGYVRYEDLPLKTKSGESRAVEFISNTYLVGDQTVIQCNIRDLTKKRAAEKALRNSEDMLRQAIKMETIGKLAGGISHDFNNVLTAINGYADLALCTAEPQGVLHDYLAQILKAGRQASALTKQLLAFSRKQILAPHILDLNSIILDMADMLTRLIGESIRVRHHLDPHLGKVMADPIQIQQILMNLAINARDAMSRGGDIDITTSNTHADPKYAAEHPDSSQVGFVSLSVSDTGTGMGAEVLARIFDPFYTTKGPGNGTGLGLSTVKTIVDECGGHLNVESAPGKGSAFRVFLPCTQTEEKGPVIHPAPDASDVGGHESILLVEDEEMVRRMCREVLETYGYAVLEAENGAAALALSDDHVGPIDLLLTDLRLPGQDGRELAKTFIHFRPQSHVLFMSGYPEDSTTVQGLIESETLFIQKPFSPAKLAGAVRAVLDRSVILAH